MKSSCQILFNHLGLPTLPNSTQFSSSKSLISLVLRCTPLHPHSPGSAPSKSKSKLYYDRRSVGHSVLVSSTHLELKTRYFSVWQLRVCWCVAPSLTRRRVYLLQCTMYNIFTFYVLLHKCICTMNTRPQSVQAQYGRSCPIFSSFRLWILVVILLHEIWDIFYIGNYFLLLWHCTIESVINCCTTVTILNILLSIGKLFTFRTPPNWPIACCSCSC
jgi:hypothetical protein